MKRTFSPRAERSIARGGVVKSCFSGERGVTLTEGGADATSFGVRIHRFTDRTVDAPRVVSFARSTPDGARFFDGAEVFSTQPDALN